MQGLSLQLRYCTPCICLSTVIIGHLCMPRCNACCRGLIPCSIFQSGIDNPDYNTCVNHLSVASHYRCVLRPQPKPKGPAGGNAGMHAVLVLVTA
jgi:hypothetical protein